MRRIIYRILALIFPTRRMRDFIRAQGIDTNAILIEYAISILHAEMDFSKISPAHGIARMIQCSNIKLLSALDKFFTTNDIEYILIGGSVIGKIRHNGCIPWDDDIDVAVIGDSWNKLFSKLLHINLGPEFSISFGTSWNMFRLHHKPTGLFIDIFRFEMLDADINADNFNLYLKRKSLYTKIHSEKRISLHHRDNIEILSSDSIQVRNNKIDKIRAIVSIENNLFEKIIRQNRPASNTGGLTHFSACSKSNEVFPHSVIYPIRRLEFEGHNFPFPNLIDDYAFIVWGDIWRLPERFSRHYDEIGIVQYFALKQLLAISDSDLYQMIFKDGEN